MIFAGIISLCVLLIAGMLWTEREVTLSRKAPPGASGNGLTAIPHNVDSATNLYAGERRQIAGSEPSHSDRQSAPANADNNAIPARPSVPGLASRLSPSSVAKLTEKEKQRLYLRKLSMSLTGQSSVATDAAKR